ncbi:HAD family hydrolase [Amnibacterium flavum]|uniref:Hydrolase n=1 Tax=Amnibacterium flavum TaxID=2173173 RepID=A0A2V1HZ14_9MICO|nr:HAD family hydrolase [Amnibacterium flavum]PVZ95854.1 hydrolase [Amnibacterium flavum]
MSAPKLVIFDLDDTLYEYAPCDRAGRAALERYAATELGLKAAGITELFATARANVKRRLGSVASSHSRLLYCHEFLELVGLRSEPLAALSMEQEYWRTFLLTAQLRPGAVELLQTLRYNTIPVAMVTDLTAQIQFRKLTYFNLDKHFDHVVCSEETREEKASLLPFELLFDRLPESVRETVWFVGDRDIDAPVDELMARGTIGTGRGFVREPVPSDRVTRWTRLAEIEREVEAVFGA